MIAAILGGAGEASAVPSYARQTGLPCSSCHTTIPELTPFGRSFKLNGYTMNSLKQISEQGGGSKSGLNLSSYLPLSAFVQFSNTVVQKPQPNTQNGNYEFPQSASIFLAGAFSKHVGGFVQVTYDSQGDHFSWDNTDVRYANTGSIGGKSVVYGFTLDNNPGVEDLWNSTPAWGFPWVSTDVAPSPSAATIVDGTLAQDVAGVGAYTMLNDHLYLDFTVYRSEHIGGSQPNPGVDPTGAPFSYNIHGLAPYWRAAWQQTVGNNYFMIGTYGMHIASSPGAIAITSLQDFYTDAAVDAQYERVLPSFHNDIITIHSTYIHESSDLYATYDAEGASQVHHNLQTFKIDGVYHFGNKYSATIAGFDTWGTVDPLLFPQADVTGSANGDPKSNGYIAGFSYWPVQNLQLGLQYTGYLHFNGAKTNYDGANRDANGNNSLYMVVWIVF
ncbi:MAG: hypothetical protein WB460_05715 [Candidatus Acidiferrales bacterium]